VCGPVGCVLSFRGLSSQAVSTFLVAKLKTLVLLEVYLERGSEGQNQTR